LLDPGLALRSSRDDNSKVRKSRHRTQLPLNRTAVDLTMASVPFVSNAHGSNPLICQGMDCRIKSCNGLPCGDVSRRQTWGDSDQQKNLQI